jgi:hypothetical protein
LILGAGLIIVERRNGLFVVESDVPVTAPVAAPS